MAAKKKPVPTKAKKGMGFESAMKDIAKEEGLPYDRAAAILASSTRKASPAAKRKNKNLSKVKGK